MRYTVEFTDRVSNSAFIYYLRANRLFGCDLVIETNYDKQLYDGREGDISLGKVEFFSKKTFFETEPDRNIESKLAIVEKKQRERGWNCIRIDGEEYFEQAIEHHLFEYKKALLVRMQLTERENIFIRELNKNR